MMTTRSWGEVLHPSLTPFSNTYYHQSNNGSTNWIMEAAQQKRSGIWTQEQNKMFENALAQFDKDTPDRWDKVASLVPGKSPQEVADHYRNLEEDVSQIEAGHILVPGYGPSSFLLDWDIDSYDVEGFTQSYFVPGRRSGCRVSDQELRKKGVPWTEDEHKLFLLGLKKYGKGDWRNISRNFVITRTPTQVASHAQKYFIRLKAGGKDKRRSSIHDITTANLSDNQPLSTSRTSGVASHSVPATTTAPTLSGNFATIGADSTGQNEVSGCLNNTSPAQGNHQIMQQQQQPLEISQYMMKFPMVPENNHNNNNVLF